MTTSLVGALAFEWVVLLLIWMHFVADFLLQSDYVATNKSKDNNVLQVHCLFYTAPFLVFGLAFAVLTFVLHFVTDYVSSRLTSKLYAAGQRHWFFVVIGADQALHLTALVLTYLYVVQL